MNESVAKYELLDAKFKQQQSDNDAYTFGINKNEIAKEVENALLSYSAINKDAELTVTKNYKKKRSGCFRCKYW